MSAYVHPDCRECEGTGVVCYQLDVDVFRRHTCESCHGDCVQLDEPARCRSCEAREGEPHLDWCEADEGRAAA